MLKRIFLSIMVAAACLCAAAQHCGNCGACCQKQKNYPEPDPKYGVFYGQRATLFNLLPVHPGDIVMLGNSLTNGCEWHELLDKPNVKNRGINGDIVDGIEERIQPILDGKPAKIFLLTGTNDVSHNLSAREIVENYEGLVDLIRTQLPDTKLYIQSLLPVNIIYGKYQVMADKNPVIVEVNTLLEQMCEKKGLPYIDLHSLFVDENGCMRADLTNDGLHLLGPGYLIWRDAIMPYINE